MCGIAGILGHQPIVQQQTLRVLAQTMMHRGPDDEGIELFPIEVNRDICLGLVHRRLAIIDLSQAGHQPMHDEETGNWIVYNGEIYNFQDIRTELEAEGIRFSSHSDTEIILNAYKVYGTDCLKKFKGMFAFAIWDQRKKILFLAVDRFGIKPLYFYKGREELFLFASEIRVLLRSGLIDKKIEPLAVDSFLAYGAVQSPLSIIKNIYSLLPAHYLIYDFKNLKMSISQYWSPGNSLSGKPITDQTKAIRGFRDLLENSVQSHLISDVPVGLFLSGGIDSSSIGALANRFNKGQFKSFSIVFSESTSSEEKYSRLMGKRWSDHHTEINVSQEDLLTILPEAIKAMDQPSVDGINVYMISKKVREAGIKTVLSGQGGDEILGGYSTFKRIPLMQRLHQFVQPLSISAREKMGVMWDGFTHRSLIRSKVSQSFESEGDIFSFYLTLRQLFHPRTRECLLDKEYGNFMNNGVPLETVRDLVNEMSKFDNFNKISFLELRLYLANTLLRDGDCMSMAHGLELRVPFLNHELVEYVFNISSEIKLQKHIQKPLLVEALRDLLPKEIYDRPKMGFTFPWEIWLRGKLRLQIEGTFNNSELMGKVGLNQERCFEIWRIFIQEKPGVTWSRVWALYVLLQWYEHNLYG